MTHEETPQAAEDHARRDDAHEITILVNKRDVTMHEREVTGRQIKDGASVPQTFKLFGPHGDEIGNDERIRIHERERFTAISGQDVS